MRITGELYQILDYKEGEGQKGKWMKQSFVVKTLDQYPKHIALTTWGDNVGFIQNLRIGDRIDFQIEVSSREYQSRWYSEVTASHIEILERVSEEPPLRQQARDQMTPKVESVQGNLLNESESEDLPF